MDKIQKVPFVTLTLGLLITVIQILRSLGGSYDEIVLMNLDWLNWEVIYAQPWRILTSPFIHQNVQHYFENLFFLSLFGYQIERTYGRGIMLGVFFGAMVTGHMVWINLMHNFIWGVSGGICGLFGFSLIAGRRTPWWSTVTHHPLHILYLIDLLWAVFIDVTDRVPFPVAHLNHGVGILYGMAFGSVLLMFSNGTRWRWIVTALPLVLFATVFYSPWLVEWQLVKRPLSLVTTNTNCQLKSIEPEVYTDASVTVINSSTKQIALYWLNYEGRPEYYFRLNPGDTEEYSLFIGHRWCVIAADSPEALQTFMVTEQNQIVTIH